MPKAVDFGRHFPRFEKGDFEKENIDISKEDETKQALSISQNISFLCEI